MPDAAEDRNVAEHLAQSVLIWHRVIDAVADEGERKPDQGPSKLPTAALRDSEAVGSVPVDAGSRMRAPS